MFRVGADRAIAPLDLQAALENVTWPMPEKQFDLFSRSGVPLERPRHRDVKDLGIPPTELDDEAGGLGQGG